MKEGNATDDLGMQEQKHKLHKGLSKKLEKRRQKKEQTKQKLKDRRQKIGARGQKIEDRRQKVERRRKISMLQQCTSHSSSGSFFQNSPNATRTSWIEICALLNPTLSIGNSSRAHRTVKRNLSTFSLNLNGYLVAH